MFQAEFDPPPPPRPEKGLASCGGARYILTSGPPEAKRPLAPSIQDILPKLTREEALDVTSFYNVIGLLPSSAPLIDGRPFLMPH